jgi:exosortase family protein XrtM
VASTPPAASIPAPPARRAAGAIGFALRFALLFALLTGLFEWSRGSEFERFVVEGLVLMPTASLINALPGPGPVETRERTLRSAGARLNVLRGCEGLECTLLLVAAMLAYPLGWRRRLWGLLLGVLLALALGVARLALLFVLLRDRPAVFEFTHAAIAPLLPVIVLGLYFLHYTGSRPVVAGAPPA